MLGSLSLGGVGYAATQLPNGTHQLNFAGAGPHVYNPSTYSYLLTPTTGWSPAKGDTMSQFVDYVLTLGQQVAPSFGYASLGLSLEQYGVNTVLLPSEAHLTGALRESRNWRLVYEACCLEY